MTAENELIEHYRMKQQMCNQVRSNYRAFIESVSKFPGVKTSLGNAMFYFDTGVLWLHEAINSLPYSPVPTPAQNPQPIADELTTDRVIDAVPESACESNQDAA